MTRRMTAEAQAERDDFEGECRDRGCSCFISPPCGHCTHPDNPLNQEDESCYVPSKASRNQREGSYAERRFWSAKA